uniref:Uncharacterized protein n=1 Tax=Mycobacterium leprae TaxID=1769 RepID=O33028_MYCLR|nr:hypothetical protein MLCB250.53c [Mycobacterium leprae]
MISVLPGKELQALAWYSSQYMKRFRHAITSIIAYFLVAQATVQIIANNRAVDVTTQAPHDTDCRTPPTLSRLNLEAMATPPLSCGISYQHKTKYRDDT